MPANTLASRTINLNFVVLLACIYLASDWLKNNQLLLELTHAHYREPVPLNYLDSFDVPRQNKRDSTESLIFSSLAYAFASRGKRLRRSRAWVLRVVTLQRKIRDSSQSRVGELSLTERLQGR